MNAVSRRIGLLALAIVSASVCSASYHFIHFTTRSAPWRGIPEKFDVNALPGKTLTYFITDQSGVQLAPNDTYAGFISQVRGAAKVWNDVETSDLRLAFGGFAAPNSPQSAPSMDIVFEELVPGLIAAGTPTVWAENNADFVPILRSLVVLSPDLRNHPSFGESMFGTLVHEVGHALGLQHTFTSGVMSTAVTRTTSRAKPLTADDIAAISLLYPARDFTQTTGSISGRVVMQGSGVNLASVVAISPSGVAVSTLTNPDGTYRIDGVPPRAYFVYAHPLPPRRQGQATPGDIVYPVDPDKREFAPSGSFFTVFYPGTNDPSRAVTVAPQAGQVVENINFSVNPRNGAGIHSVDTRAFPSRVAAVKPPYLSPNMTYPFIVVSGSGLINGSAPMPGLAVSVLGGATLTVKPYSPSPTTHIQVDFDVRTLSFVNDSARHLVFSQGGDIYVLPAAFFHVDKAPPSITSIAVADTPAQRSAIITGTNFNEGSRVFFDGVFAPIREFDAATGRMTVTPPVAAPNHRASVVVLNADGQSSLFLEGDSPSTYTYSGEPSSLSSQAPGFTLSPNTLTAGTETLVQIDVAGGSLTEGQTTIGFGSSDIVVRNSIVVSPTRMLANVAVSPTAQSGYAQVSLVSGLQLIAQPFGLQVLPAVRTFWLSSVIRNAVNANSGVSPGAPVTLKVNNPPISLNATNFVLLLNDQAIPVLSAANNEIVFEVPASASVGPATLRIDVNGEKSLPILLIVEPPPPRIVAAHSGLPTSDAVPKNTQPVHTGQLLTVTVDDLAAPGVTLDPSKIAVRLGGVELQVAQVLERSNLHQLIVIVNSGAPSGDEVPLTVSLGTRTSDPLKVSVQSN